MDNRPDIWRQLKDHEIPPPAEVRDGLRPRLDPPGEQDSSGLRRLQAHSVPPPSFLRSALATAIEPTKRGLGRRLLPYAAAASLLLVITGLVLERSAHHSRSAASAATVAGTKPRPKTGASAGGTATSGDTAASGDSAGAASGRIADSALARLMAIRILPPAINTGDSRFALVDNNPLATFTSFKYPALKTWVDKRSAAGLRIHLDQYTNILLSPAMGDMIKELYDTRPNGMPGRKARKTKEKLDKWKAADEKQFDAVNQSNPLDPTDLAEFLFPAFLSFGRAPVGPVARLSLARPSDFRARRASDNLTVSYTLTIVSKKANTGIGEAYNGGIETLFDDGSRGRLRLASLMRIQSVFLSEDHKEITVLKESARHRTKTTLTADQWSRYNDKYAGANCSITADTARILGYTCKKALLTLKDGRRLTAWYTPQIQAAGQPLLQPAFNSLPGLVLRYEYTCRHKTLRYSAAALSHNPIDGSVFQVPAMP